VALAALLREKWLVAGIFLGLAIAANQFIILIFPLLALYCVRLHDFKTIIVSILVASVIILPFMMYSPSKFMYDVLLFQLQRPMQNNGIWSLYYVVYSLSGFRLQTYLRFVIFLVPSGIVTYLFSRAKKNLLIGLAIISALAAAILPVDGFWNYFLLPATIVCTLVPSILTDKRLQRYVFLNEVKPSSSPHNIGSPPIHCKNQN
jgi:uncharacterized membrane protein